MIIGPGSVPEVAESPRPTLDGASEYEYVTILNPLTVDFAVLVAQDIPVNMPAEIRAKTGLVQEESDVVRNYGLSLKNPDFQSKKRMANRTIIKAGETIRMRGSEAQVAVRQLVNEILQREGKTRLASDPHLRKEVEDRIIVDRGSVQDILGVNLTTPQEQALDAINQSNEVTNDFPELEKREATTSTESVDSPQDNGAKDPRSKPKKA